jgi:hypothetical protein
MKKIILLSIICIFAFTAGAFAQEFSITIDAQKDTFYQGLTGNADGVIFLPARAYLRDQGTPPTDNIDISAIVWTAWDDDYLYFYAEVTDDVVKVTNGSTYNNDCIEVKFDPDPTVGVGLNTSNCRLTALDSADAGNVSGVDNLNKSGHLEDHSGVDYKPSPTDYARRITDDGYALEFRIPLDFINELNTTENRYLVRGEGQKFGMAININDNDTDIRDHMLQWSAGHHNDAHSNAALLGSATYLADHKLGLLAVSPRADSIANDSADVWYANIPVGIIANPKPVESYYLLLNYPNPFNPNTVIKYQLKQTEKISLTVYSINGEVIRHLASDQMHFAGSHEITWDGRNDSGVLVNSGIYFCRLTTPTQTFSLKMTLIK